MGRMTLAEAEAFLAAPHVATIGLSRPGSAPLVVPLWYYYVPGGEIGLWMDGQSYKVRRLRAVPHLTLCVQDTVRPYRYVSVEGAVVSIAPIDFDRELVPLVARYLDDAARARYLADLGGPAGIAGDVYVRVATRRWRAEDLGR